MSGRKSVLRAAIILVTLTVATQSGAFVRDTHYGVTFVMALSTCFDWEEAHLIASADFMIDQNKTTKAESNPLKKKSKVGWHAFSHSGERYLELWDRALAEQDPDLQLVKFGQFLHFLQDWESHAGFGNTLGHAKATITGHDPDSLALSESRTFSAAQSTLEQMGKLCAHRGSLPKEFDGADVALIDYLEDFLDGKVISDLVDSGNPKWRKGKTGGLNRQGKRILALNQERLEVRVLEVRPLKEGWMVRVEVKNIGASAVDQGTLTFVASDPETGDELASLEQTVPALAPGAGIELEGNLAASRASEEFMSSVVLDGADLSALNDFAWYTPGEELEELEQEQIAEREATSEEQDRAEIEVGFVDESGTGIPIPRCLDRFWSITPEGRFVPPAVKSYECLRPLDSCSLLPETEKLPALRFHAEAGAGENETLVPLDGELGERIRRSCAATRGAGYVQSAGPVGEDPVGLRVLTFNVWHGLRSGESKTKFPGEDEERRERRFAWQIRSIKELDPDILLFQEVNPNQREARTYAEALGYDEIHKVTSCGVHLPPIKLPKNVNDGIAILARPGLKLRRVQTKRLSGDAACTATFGFQTKESRYALLGEITVEGQQVLLVTTHLSSSPYVPPGFEEDLEALMADGVLTEEQRAEIMDTLERKRARNLGETRELLEQIRKYRKKRSKDGRPVPVILGGDFNTEPETASIVAIVDSGLQNVASGPDYLTWDPVKNHENQRIGSKRGWPLPTYDLQEVEMLLAPRETTARQIDFLFVSEQGEVVSSKMAMDQDRQGLFPSDHFAIFAVIDLDLDPPELGLSGAAGE